MYVQVGDRHNRKRRSASREYHAKFVNILLICSGGVDKLHKKKLKNAQEKFQKNPY